MGRVRTVAAKKFHEKKTESDSEDESLSNLNKSIRSKRGAALNNKPSSSRETSGRANRSTRSTAPIPKQNGKNDATNNNSSDTSSGEEEEEKIEAIVSRKRKSSIEKTTPKKPKPSTSTNVKKTTEYKPKSSKKKKNEERYEVEEILDHKIEDNKKYFLIRWKGYDSSVDSWESNYSISCPILLAKYYEKHPDAKVSLKDKRKKKKKNVVTKPRQLKIDEELDYDSNWDENEDYEVEKILDVYIHRNNKREFLIRWKGYSSNSDSWEPEDNLDCIDLINKFMEKVDKMKNLNEKELRPVRLQTQRFTLMTQESARRLSKRNAGRQRAVYFDCDE